MHNGHAWSTRTWIVRHEIRIGVRGSRRLKQGMHPTICPPNATVVNLKIAKCLSNEGHSLESFDRPMQKNIKKSSDENAFTQVPI